jgi:hypothetical protein
MRIANAGGKCSDLFCVSIQVDANNVVDHDGYVPMDLGIGGGDYMEISYCLDCGQIQGTWPLSKTNLEEKSVAKFEEE